MKSSRRPIVSLGIFLSLFTAMPASPVSALEPGLRWQFGVLLDDKKIGYHNYHVSQDGDRQRLETDAEFDVKFLFVTAFRYRHRNVESWKNGCLSSIDASTNSNGKELDVKGRRAADGFEVTGKTGSSTLPDCVQTFAYWNPEILEADRLLNSQTGEYEDVSVAFESDDVVNVGDRAIDALRYRLSAKAGDITLWYSAVDRRWLALEAPAKGGRTLRYEPIMVPELVSAGHRSAQVN